VFVSLFYMLRTDLKLDICGKQIHAHYGAHVSESTLSKVTCSQVPGALHSAKFLFLPDITSKATGAALIVLIVLYVGSQLASTLIATATADPNQRRLMLLLPVVFVVILYRYPAGLLVYWITTNMWTIAQQYLIKKRMPPPPRPETAKGAANGKPLSALKAALAGAAGAPTPVTDGAPNGGSASPPPRSPRKKKKRSGRRR